MGARQRPCIFGTSPCSTTIFSLLCFFFITFLPSIRLTLSLTQAHALSLITFHFGFAAFLQAEEPLFLVWIQTSLSASMCATPTKNSTKLALHT